MTAATCCYGIRSNEKYKGFLVSRNRIRGEQKIEVDVTEKKLQPEPGWHLNGRYRGRNVNVICFPFKKSSFAISAGQTQLCLGVST